MEYIVIVGTDPDTALPEYRDAAGTHYYGPMSAEEASNLVTVITEGFGRLDPREFVYGTPFATMEPVQPDTNAARAIRNWHLPLDSELRQP